MNDIIWNCQAGSFQGGGQAAPLEVTVGEKFQLNCQGPVVAWSQQNVSLNLSPEQKYLLKVLQLKRLSEDGLEAITVSYRVGDHQNIGFQLSDGSVGVRVEGFNLKVKSVIQNQGQPVQPFPPFPFIGLSYPLWLWTVLMGVVLLTIGSAIWVWLVRRKRRNLVRQVMDSDIMAETLLKTLPEHLRPYTQAASSSHFNELFRLVRKLIRQHPFVESKTQKLTVFEKQQALEVLNHIFHLYLARKLSCPAHVWSVRQILKEVQRLKLEPALRTNLQLTLDELEKAIKNVESVNADQYRQLVRLVQQTVLALEEEIKREQT